jgi:tetratricopeptide (TPR) repeat protein
LVKFFKKKNEAKLSDEEDKAIVRSIWQKEKLAAAMGEEDDNIPEAVFEMAINSINKQEIMVSESLAEIHAKQGRFEKAIEIYRKLSLQNPEKKTYFAAKINHLNKENLS